ncbi:Uncharacterised protein [Mycobacteroides abscessus subsp. abscessus]|nr:Uncharacterised protein [Mycobacteroides abscessus subsp. abscessus]
MLDSCNGSDWRMDIPAISGSSAMRLLVEEDRSMASVTVGSLPSRRQDR